MEMTLQPVTERNQHLLVEYAARCGAEHDTSYLPGRDFSLSEEYPSYLLLGEGGDVLGAVCLMRIRRYLNLKQARFAIFHSTLGTSEAYERLLAAIQPHLQDLESVFLFIPEERTGTAAILEALGFRVQRYSYLLTRENREPAQAAFPEGYAVQAVEPGDRVGLEEFTRTKNEAFSELAGSTPAAPEDLAEWFQHETYLAGGMCLLKKGQEPVGTIWVMRDNEDPAAGEILSFGILKSQRGLNLGRTLLRHGINLALEFDLHPINLSVNAENKAALDLYLSEGFAITEGMVCYSLLSA